MVTVRAKGIQSEKPINQRMYSLYINLCVEFNLVYWLVLGMKAWVLPQISAELKKVGVFEVFQRPPVSYLPLTKEKIIIGWSCLVFLESKNGGICKISFQRTRLT